jgi:SAM-dependent methyltransferase
MIQRFLQERLRMLRGSYWHAQATGLRRASVLRYVLFTAYADIFRRSRSLTCDFDALSDADLCSHSNVYAIRWLPRLIVRCRACGVAFATVRDNLNVATERHDGDYFLANKDFIYPDGKPDIFTYVMPRTLFFWALGFYGFRPANRRALDVGCGVGIMVRYLEFLGFDAEGVEISSWAVDYARNQLGLRSVRAGTVYDMHYSDGSFGLVTLVHVLEHVDDPVPLIRELFRILEPGGVLYVEVPSSERDTSDYFIDDHFWFYSKHALHRLLACIGFRDVQIGEGTFDHRLHNVPFIFARASKPKQPEPPLQ